MNSKFILKLSFLLVPFAIFTLLLLDGHGNGGIGGGGYDLSGLVYGMALFTCIVLWMLWMLVLYFIRKTVTERKSQLVLLTIGAGAFIAAWFITPRMF